MGADLCRQWCACVGMRVHKKEIYNTLIWAPVKPRLRQRVLWHYSLSPAARNLWCHRALRKISGPLLGFRGKQHIFQSDFVKLNRNSATGEKKDVTAVIMALTDSQSSCCFLAISVLWKHSLIKLLDMWQSQLNAIQMDCSHRDRDFIFAFIEDLKRYENSFFSSPVGSVRKLFAFCICLHRFPEVDKTPECQITNPTRRQQTSADKLFAQNRYFLYTHCLNNRFPARLISWGRYDDTCHHPGNMPGPGF